MRAWLSSEQRLRKLLVEGQRRVAGGVNSARDTDIDLAESDLVRRVHDRLQPGAARLLQVEPREYARSSLEPSTTSRVRLKSRLCLRTAPAATCPTRSPASANRATRPSRAAPSMSGFDALA